MMDENKVHIILCNGASLNRRKKKGENRLVLDYDPTSSKKNVKIRLPDFVSSLNHLPDRIKDLLEIAGLVYAADRKTLRGRLDAVEYHHWARSFQFHIRVRDFKFWNRIEVRQKLNSLLQFMTGDKVYEFHFHAGRNNHPFSLFDSEQFGLSDKTKTRVILFSGGLDSLTGIFESIKTTDDTLCLVSHQSGQPGTAKTQKMLYAAINKLYPNRCLHYKFSCSLSGEHSADETQRTRSFLYTSIAFSLAKAFSQNEIHVYENGITSINFPKRQDLMNARASRTTHPKTLHLLQEFFSLLNDKTFVIHHPYLLKTKSEVVETLVKYGGTELINSSVSCSKTYLNTSQFTHCGGCSQCVDRRFAMYFNKIEAYDESGIYELNFIKDALDDGFAKTTLLDYIRLASNFSKTGIDAFYHKYLNILVDLDDYIPGGTEDERVEQIYKLCKRHGEQVESALERMRSTDRPFENRTGNTLLALLATKEYLKAPVILLVENICQQLNKAIPIAFSKTKPNDENAFNSYVNSYIEKERDNYEREHPSIRFALCNTVPDHSVNGYQLLIESKYLRGNTSPSKVTEGIAADLTKYPSDSHKLFVIYDPERKIADDQKFKTDFESKGNCTINITR